MGKTLQQMIEMSQGPKKMAQSKGGAVLPQYVSPKHARWLEEDRDFSPRAIARAVEVLENKHKVERTNRFSASALGLCPRRQLFSFAGIPQAKDTTQSANIMRLGTALHFWMMVEGMTAGWLKEAEVFFRDDELRVGGTVDGLMDDDSLWEYKAVASSVFSKVAPPFAIGEEGGPKPEHTDQTAGYEMITGIEVKSLFYEERNYGDYYEYRLGSQPETVAKVRKMLLELNAHENDNTLPPRYDDCDRQTGYVFKACPFREICPFKEKLYG